MRPFPTLTAILVVVLLHGIAAGAAPPAGVARSVEPCASVEGGAGAAALRLATFDTAWHRIHVTHFDTAFNGVDWRALRAELRPRAAAARCTAELRTVISEMLGRLGQSHFALIPKEHAGGLERARRAADERPGELGMELRLVGDTLVVWRVARDGAAAAAGVRPGWALLAADTVELAERARSVPAEIPARQRTMHALAAVGATLAGDVGERARLRFLDDAGRGVEVDIVRRPAAGMPATFGNLPTLYTVIQREDADGGRIGVVRFNAWMPAIVPGLDSAIERFRSRDGIVLDLRGNPGGVAGLMMGASGHFLETRTSLGTMKNRAGELRYNANPRLVNAAGERVRPFAGPVAILVDEMTGSTSEAFAAGMQAIGRARIVGRPSAGAVLPAVMRRLPNGDVLYHAIADFIAPDGTRLEGRGVLPDDDVALTRDALLAGRDPQMDAALAWIRRTVEDGRRAP
jgi:carboxyl-terminal processing protease